MLSHHISKLLRRSYSRVISTCRGFASTNVETDSLERDPASFFFNKEIQQYLQRLTTLDYSKVFRTRKDGHKQTPPQFKFLTDEELEEAKKAAEYKAKRYLQMPPMVKQRLEPSATLCEDPALQSHDTVKYVFTDISFGLKDRQRSVVVRDPDGTLRHASWEERDRIIQTFLPKPKRELQKPKMFEGEYLKDLLNRKEYEFILDRACVQFEPDNPDYQAVTREVYEHINAEKHFDILRSTRHFGPMVFHLVWTSNIDNLLYEMIETNRIEDAALLIRLYHMIHPTTKSAVEQCEHADDVNFVMHYVRLESLKSDKIEKLLQSYKELQRERQIVAEGIKQAHGISSETDKT
ncbi:PREDICTED: 28S ribosomal protein S22, mitochondrial [Cyphomyrmex costatus]|uniref:28S ribosomal protein S22, mitochondrial n=1 Tax=Cyphomyrmex costatus TaxID=456900 RepID=A0A195CL05_9HYME|nr:PREDICTED: 28S ribosomal protein S22, mitochondrial [Cyphomyrmex costatus]KYN00764.1 28S ribosomal protein S22, mitochondrial [Cyphomyrmex costatus]